MSSFTKSGISVVPPVGSIMAYMGTSDPEGWVICDGTSRINSDGKYNALINLGIGSSTYGVYTPPDLTGRFLYGAKDTAPGDTAGASEVTLAEGNMPSHTHTFTDDYFSAVANTWVGGGSAGGGWVGDSVSTSRTTASTGTGDSFNIMPPYFAVNYILKY